MARVSSTKNTLSCLERRVNPKKVGNVRQVKCPRCESTCSMKVKKNGRFRKRDLKFFSWWLSFHTRSCRVYLEVGE